jgi:hypothetical protein
MLLLQYTIFLGNCYFGASKLTYCNIIPMFCVELLLHTNRYALLQHDSHTATSVETLCVRDEPELTQPLLEFPEQINKNTSWKIVDVYVHQSLV